jgi:3',5'-cyclic-nucleotide phosphodiesterase
MSYVIPSFFDGKYGAKRKQARPWVVAEKWTDLLQLEFANQGEMESAVGMETVLFGGPPEIGNVLKLANSQIGFMTIFAHPLFQNVTDLVPAMGFASAEILNNKGVWFTKLEQEKRIEQLKLDSELGDGGAISPRSQSPVEQNRRRLLEHQHLSQEREATGYFPPSPLRNVIEPPPSQEHSGRSPRRNSLHLQTGSETKPSERRRSSTGAPIVTAMSDNALVARSGDSPTSRRSSGALSGGNVNLNPQTPSLQTRPSNALPTSQLQLGDSDHSTTSTVMQGKSENDAPRQISHHDGADERRADASASNTSPDSDASSPGSSSHQHQSLTSTTPSFFPFAFTTSRPPEPTRTVRPSTYNQVTFCGDHASVPSSSNTNFDRTSMATSGATSASTTDIGTRTTMGMLSPSTEATSVVSAESDGRQMSKRTEENLSRRERDPDFEARRSRAASAPTRFPLFPHRGSRESSKQDVRTTVFGHENLNGDLFSKGGTVPRRRSRMRLAFWKKRSDSGIE